MLSSASWAKRLRKLLVAVSRSRLRFYTRPGSFCCVIMPLFIQCERSCECEPMRLSHITSHLLPSPVDGRSRSMSDASDLRDPWAAWLNLRVAITYRVAKGVPYAKSHCLCLHDPEWGH